MKYFYLSILAALCITIPAGQSFAQGNLSVDQSLLKFGTIIEGPAAQRMVYLTNAGNTDIVIDNVTSS
jgi:hypothetical protein